MPRLGRVFQFDVGQHVLQIILDELQQLAAGNVDARFLQQLPVELVQRTGTVQPHEIQPLLRRAGTLPLLNRPAQVASIVDPLDAAPQSAEFDFVVVQLLGVLGGRLGDELQLPPLVARDDVVTFRLGPRRATVALACPGGLRRVGSDRDRGHRIGHGGQRFLNRRLGQIGDFFRPRRFEVSLETFGVVATASRLFDDRREGPRAERQPSGQPNHEQHQREDADEPHQRLQECRDGVEPRGPQLFTLLEPFAGPRGQSLVARGLPRRRTRRRLGRFAERRGHDKFPGGCAARNSGGASGCEIPLGGSDFADKNATTHRHPIVSQKLRL